MARSNVSTTLTLLLALLIGAATFSPAQQITTSLRGTVTDPNGAVVPQATVILESPDTGTRRTTSSDKQGAYQFLQIPPGLYLVTASAPGFATVKAQNIRLLVNTPATVNLALRVAEASTTVEVTGATPTINTQDATIGNAFGTAQIASLPFEGRDPVGILSLQPGVAYVGSKTDQTADSRNGSVNGARSDQTNVTLDGVDNNDQSSGFAFEGALRATLDSLQEFRVTTSNSNADTGRSSGAQVSLVTKSGTNNWHGSVYEYHRPTFTTANDWFNKKSQLESGLPNRAPKLIRNTFGASVGGPLIKDRLFFFATYEGQRTRETTQITRIIPSETLRQGIVRYIDANGNVQTLTPQQLASMDPNCTANGTCPLGPGPNPEVLKIFQQYPLPNTDSVGDGLNYRGFTFAAATPSKLDTYIVKMDMNLDKAGNHHLFVRGNLQNDHIVPSAGGLFASVTATGVVSGASEFPGQPANSTLLNNSKGISVGYNGAIRNNLINSLRYGYVRQGTGEAGLQSQPKITFRGMDDPQGFTSTRLITFPVHNVLDDVTWTKGKHTVQFGGNVRFLNDHRTSNEASFLGAETNVSWLDNAAIANTGSSLDPAAFGFPAVSDSFSSSYDSPVAALTGLLTEGFSNYNLTVKGGVLPQGAPSVRHFRSHEAETYMQDSWRIKNNLTITLGVRYSLLQPPYEVNGQQAAPDVSLNQFFQNRQAAMNAGQTYKPIVSFAASGQANGKDPYWDWDYKDIAPRFALAWSPSAEKGFFNKLFGSTGKTSIRLGYGIYYDHFGEGIVDSFDKNGSFGLTTQFSNPAGVQDVDTAPRFTGLNQMPAALILPPPCSGLPCTPPATLDAGGFEITWGLDNKLKTPYAHVFNLSWSRELPKNFVLETAYVGRLGRRLLQEDDLAMPLNIRDPKSGVDYFTAATQFSKAFRAGVPIQNIGTIPYWQNMFPGAAGPFSAVGSGCAPGAQKGQTPPANLTATQSMYDIFSCFNGNETSALFSIDLPDSSGNCFPSCSILGPFAFFDPQWSSLYAWRSIGKSNYNALQLMLRHRGNGLQFDFNYTWSKSIDQGSNAERINTFEGIGFASQIINAWSPAQLRAVSDFDTTHQFNSNWVWDLPVGKSRKFGSGFHGITDAILGGWTLSGVFRWTSGYPFTIEPGLGFWATNWELTSADVQTSTKLPQTGTFRDSSGNPNVFKDPASAINDFRTAFPGESGQRNNLRGPGFFGIDTGVSKSWKLTERQAIKFSWETFNVTNTPRFDVGTLQLSGNNTTANNTSFGKFTSTLTSPRVMQFALRYSF